MAFNKINKPYVLVNKIVNNIKEEIISGNIKPGQRIIEAQIAREKIIKKSGNDKFIKFINILDKKVKEMELAVKENKIDKLAREDIEFHRKIVSFCGNRFLLETWEKHNLQIRILLNIETKHQFVESPKEHKQLVTLIREKKVKQVKECIKEHIFKSLEIFVNSVSKKG